MSVSLKKYRYILRSKLCLVTWSFRNPSFQEKASSTITSIVILSKNQFIS